ncbi:MAG: beta-lactamase family protein [Verrucomicrobiales bacterium]|nr:beta-lactamase family protein [Verrucomicrobiales bacterium]
MAPLRWFVLLLRAAAVPSALALACPAFATSPELPRSSPESQGVSSARVHEFVEALDRIESIHGVMLLRHGRVVAEGWWAPYDRESRHELYSLSKSFTSTAVGFAVAEGLLTVDDEVTKFFPQDLPADPSANLKAMRVRDLLTMSAGHQDETSSAPDRISAKAFLAHPVPHKPGTHFKYNTPATFMLSAIVQQRTGHSILDYLKPRLFEPLGIDGPIWSTNFQGISLGGYGLRVRTEDIARFGQLYLQEGSWNGRRILPASWIREASARQVSNGSNPASDWDQGYGYQFWRCRHGAYRGDGAFGQYCIVFPEQDAVLAITSGVRDMQAVLNVVWDKLLPAFHPRRLPRDKAASARLSARLMSLRIPTPEGTSTSARAEGALGRTFRFPTNDQRLDALALESDPTGQGWVLVRTSEGVEARVPCGHGVWRKCRGPFGPNPDESLAAAGAWTSDNTFVAKICARETPYIVHLKLRFEGDEVVAEQSMNVSFGNSAPSVLTGRASTVPGR